MNKILRLCATAALLGGSTATWCSTIPSSITSISPTPGSTVEKIDVIEINAGWLTPKATTKAILIDGLSAAVTVTQPADNYDKLTFTLATAITANGTHTVTFPENSFLIGWEDDPSPEFSFELTVENDIPGGDTPGGDEIFENIPEGYTVAPAAGEEVGVLTTITVSSETHLFLAPKLNPGITINGNAVNTVHALSGETENTITWTLADPINTPGIYNIQIPAGAFYDLQDEDNAPFLFTVKVAGGEIPDADYYPATDVTSDPTNGSTVNELAKFALQYPKHTSVFKGPAAGEVRVTLNNTDIDAVVSLAPAEDTFNDAHIMWISTEQPLKAAGVYTFHFPAKCFVVSKYPVNKYSAPFTLTFTVDPDYVAIDEVNADVDADADTEYFTPAGVKVGRPVAPGLYLRRTTRGTAKVIVR